MYEIKITNGKLDKLSIVGDLNTICAEVISSIGIVWDKIKEHDKKAANVFKTIVTAAFKDDVMFCESKDDEDDALLKMLQARIKEFDE